MQHQAIIKTQLDFYRKGEAGCLFAAFAAENPAKFGWRLSVSDVTAINIGMLVRDAICAPDVSTQSIIFPSVVKESDLKQLLLILFFIMV
jgi:hypothetical protein